MFWSIARLAAARHRHDDRVIPRFEISRRRSPVLATLYRSVSAFRHGNCISRQPSYQGFFHSATGRHPGRSRPRSSAIRSGEGLLSSITQAGWSNIQSPSQPNWLTGQLDWEKRMVATRSPSSSSRPFDHAPKTLFLIKFRTLLVEL